MLHISITYGKQLLKRLSHSLLSEFTFAQEEILRQRFKCNSFVLFVTTENPGRDREVRQRWEEASTGHVSYASPYCGHLEEHDFRTPGAGTRCSPGGGVHSPE